MRHSLFVLCFAATSLLTSCSNSGSSSDHKEDSTASALPAQMREENVSYSADSVTMNGYVVYKDSGGKKPGILIVHEWWGLNDYPKTRANQLAEMGYVAMAVDMYGNGRTATNPTEANNLASPFYTNPQLAKTRLDAALAKLKTYDQVDTSRIAAIGYCYGGYVVLNAAKLGADLDGVVSFHGNLGGAAPDKNAMKAKVLVCHGEADGFVPPKEQAMFKKQMDSVGADYTFKSYPNAKHAFTNPAATENGIKFKIPIEYNAEADKNSWNDMKDFFEKIFK